MTRLLPIALLLGCNEPLRLSLHSAWGGAIEHPRTYVDEACDLLDTRCEQDEGPWGVVVVQFAVFEDGTIQGSVPSYEDRHGCRRACVSSRDGRMLAHELAHVLTGKGDSMHSSDPGNLMHLNPGSDLTDEQLDAIHDGIDRLGMCR